MSDALKGLLEERDSRSGELDKLTRTVEEEKRDLSDDEETRSSELLSEIDEIDERISEENKKAEKRKLITEARSRIVESTPDVAVTNEPMMYGGDSEYSYVADFVRANGGMAWTGHEQARERLDIWGHQVEREIAHNENSPENRGAMKQIREHMRGAMGDKSFEDQLKEVRIRGRASLEEKRTGITSGGGATATASSGGAAFVTPVFYDNEYAPYREFGREFADACHARPLPPYGMNIYLPDISRGVKVESQVEGEAVAEQTPELGYRSAGLITPAGQVIVSQQLLDRSGPNADFDRMVFDQLQRRLALEVDSYVLKKAGEAGTSQEWTGNSGAFQLFEATAGKVGGFIGQVAKAKASVRTTAGTVLNPTHLFVRADRWEQIAAWTNTLGNPVIQPGYSGVFQAIAAGNGSGDEGIEGDTGYRLLGLPTCTDQNIPTKGTTGRDQAIIGDLNEVYVYEGAPVPRVIPQTYAQNLQVLLDLYEYLAVLVRYPSALVFINGTGMATIAYEK